MLMCWVTWSKVGVWPPICALLERTQEKVFSAPFSADKKIAVRVHIERPVCRPGWNNDWGLPGDPAVSRSLELDAVAATVNAIARLILESVTRAAGLIDGKPLLVAAFREAVGLKLCPGLAAVS